MYPVKPHYVTNDTSGIVSTNVMYPVKPVYESSPVQAVDLSKLDLSSRQDLLISNIESQIRRVDQILSETRSSIQSTARGGDCSSKCSSSVKSSFEVLNVKWPAELCYPIDIAINCHPHRVPITPFALRDLLGTTAVLIRTHVHSSYKSSLPAGIAAMEKKSEVDVNTSRTQAKLIFTIIVRNDVPDMTFMCDPVKQTPVYGEANLVRFICRMLPLFPSVGVFQETVSDHLVDVICDGIFATSNKQKNANALKTVSTELGKRSKSAKGSQLYLVCDKVTAADFCLHAALAKLGNNSGIPANIQGWQKSTESVF